MEGDFQRLSEGCISHVMSLTSPEDSCRSATVSMAFRSAVDSDTVWERFLPSDYKEMLDRAVDAVEYSSKRDLYFRLCDPILIDGDKMSFALDKPSGAKCYMISARELGIVWADTPHYWKWISVADSSLDARFAEVVHLLNVCWLEIQGRIDCRLLSTKTNYAAYLVFKLDTATRGLSYPAQEASVKLGGHESKHSVLLQPAETVELSRTRVTFRRRFFHGMVGFLPDQEHEDSKNSRVPCSRVDGWMEIELGEFFNDNGDDGEVCMSFLEVERGHWKSGLIVQGIELRPKRGDAEGASILDA